MTRLLITGCARSGTGWLAECLRTAGITCGHEHAYGPYGPRGFVNWQAESSWLAAPYTPTVDADVHVVHLVRDPRKVIRSNAERGTFGPGGVTKPWGDYAMRRVPKIREGRTRTERAGIYWVEWNRLVVADEILRLEDVTVTVINGLARLVDPGAAGLEELPPPANVQDPRLVTHEPYWEQVANVPGLMQLAGEMGYR